MGVLCVAGGSEREETRMDTLSRTSEKRGGRLLVCEGGPPAPLDLFIASLDALTSGRASERVSSTLSARIDSDERARPSPRESSRGQCVVAVVVAETTSSSAAGKRRRPEFREYLGPPRAPLFRGILRGGWEREGERRASFDGKDTAEGRARLSRRRVAVTREGLFLLARPTGPFSAGERNCDAKSPANETSEFSRLLRGGI